MSNSNGLGGDLLGGDDKKILSTGYPDIDKKLADGLPLGSDAY